MTARALDTKPAQDATTAVQKVPIQTPGENEILVKVGAIAINPTDWKRSPYHILMGGRFLN